MHGLHQATHMHTEAPPPNHHTNTTPSQHMHSCMQCVHTDVKQPTNDLLVSPAFFKQKQTEKDKQRLPRIMLQAAQASAITPHLQVPPEPQQHDSSPTLHNGITSASCANLGRACT